MKKKYKLFLCNDCLAITLGPADHPNENFLCHHCGSDETCCDKCCSSVAEKLLTWYCTPDEKPFLDTSVMTIVLEWSPDFGVIKDLPKLRIQL